MGIMDTKKELTQIAKVRIGLCCISFLSAIAAFVECKGTILPLEIARYILTFNFSVFMIQFTFFPVQGTCLKSNCRCTINNVILINDSTS